MIENLIEFVQELKLKHAGLHGGIQFCFMRDGSGCIESIWENGQVDETLFFWENTKELKKLLTEKLGK